VFRKTSGQRAGGAAGNANEIDGPMSSGRRHHACIFPARAKRPGGQTVRNDKRSQVTETWIDVTLTLGGLVAVFGGMAGALIVLFSSAARP
jgi:hypothetical protein